MNSQKGYIDFKGALLAFAVICGLVGWGVVSALIWVFSHVNVSWV